MRLGLPRPTVRRRITAAAVGVTIVMLAAGSFAILAIQRRALTAGIDEALRQRADNLMPLDPSDPRLPSEGDREDSFAQLVGRHGVIAHTNNLSAPALASVSRVSHSVDAGRGGFRTIHLDHPHGRYRVLVRSVTLDSGTAMLALGKNVDDVSESVKILTTTLVGVVPVFAILLGVLAWWLTGRTLRPVEAIRREVESIDGQELHRRVPVPATDDEVAGLARTMNHMLARVESASTRQQRFLDDASHELRTPLTQMVTDIEVALAHPGQEAAADTLRRLRDSGDDLRQLVDDLLYLSRDRQDRAPARDEVDLDDIALRVSHDLRARSDITVDTSGIGAARVLGDGRALERAARNLIDNAARHARSIVAVSTEETDGECRLIVDDDGPGIAAADRARVFERFTRLDAARSRSDGGAGLGLAIVADIATRHNGTVVATDSPTGGARLCLSLPALGETL